MKKLCGLFLLFILISCKVDRKPQIDVEIIKKTLDSILKEDQRYRGDMDLGSSKEDSIRFWENYAKQRKIDESNLKVIEGIISQVGEYPGISLVGHSASETAFYVLQHAPDSIQSKYLDLILEASKKNELRKTLGSMYHDRFLMFKGKPQIYGTQVRLGYKKDSITGLRTEIKCLWPIADTTNIDSLRLWNGLLPLQQYLEGFGLSRWEDCSLSDKKILFNNK